VPSGWIIVTAGNPPEYNNSVRELDVVTLDRLKRIEVKPDFDVWKEYAYTKGIHPSVITYLEIKKSDFYSIETTVDGKSFVTARGWSDLSDMIKLYEMNNIVVHEGLVAQYLQNKKIAKSFAIYYDMFKKYRSDYQVRDILDGRVSMGIKARAKEARFDERLSLLGLILDAVTADLREVIISEQLQEEILKDLQTVKLRLNTASSVAEIIRERAAEREKELERAQKASAVTADGAYVIKKTVSALISFAERLEKEQPSDSVKAFSILKNDYTEMLKAHKSRAKKAGESLSNVFKFCEEVYGEGQEILILVTELTISSYASKFIVRYGCAEYFKHNKELLFYERQTEIINQIEILDLD
jgi:hypothetical protein